MRSTPLLRIADPLGDPLHRARTRRSYGSRQNFVRSVVNVATRLAGILALAMLTVGSAPAADDAATGWVDLLAGGDLAKHWTTTGNWTLSADGVATLTPRQGEKGWQRYDAYLTSKQQYADFQLELEYKVEKSGNSGVYFHVGDPKSPVATGIEVQVYDSHGKPADKALTDHDSGGIIPGLPPSKNTSKPAGEWNRFVITSKGRQVTVELNGTVVNEVSLDHPKLKDRPARGYLAIQDHGLPLAVRKIRVRPLE